MRRIRRSRPWERRRLAGTRAKRAMTQMPARRRRSQGDASIVIMRNENRCGRTRALAGGVAPGYSRRMSTAAFDAYAAVKALAGAGARSKHAPRRFRGPTVAAIELPPDAP